MTEEEVIEQEEVMDEEVVEISDDSDAEDFAGKSAASVEISAFTDQSDDQIEEEAVEGEEVIEEEVVEEEEVVVKKDDGFVARVSRVFEPVEYDEIIVSSNHDLSYGSEASDPSDYDSFAEEEIEVEPPSDDVETVAEQRIEEMGQIDNREKVEQVVAAPDDEIDEHDDSWDPGRRRNHQKLPISPTNDDQYANDGDSFDSHPWMPHCKQPSHDASSGVTPRTSHRKSEGIHLEDAINSIDGAPFSPATSKPSFDTTIKSSDTLDNWNISPQIETSWRHHPVEDQAGNYHDQSNRGEKDSSESDDSSLIRRQKQVQFSGLPEHPPELRKHSHAHLTVVQEKSETGSSSSYETDSSASSSVYETDSSASEDGVALPSLSYSGRRLTVNYRPSTSVRSAPGINQKSFLPRTQVSPGSSDTSDVESQPQPEYFAAAETRPKDSTFFKACIICLALLLLVGTALSLYFFYEFTSDEHRDMIQFSPTIAPGRPPTRPTGPPILPTISSTKSPSQPKPVTPTPDSPTTPIPNAPTPPPSSPTRFPFQNNDECVDAIGPLLPGASTLGTTMNAREDDVNSCDNTSNNGLPGVWYYVLGNGGEMMAHTCSNTDIDSKISIYDGSCSNPQCLEVSDNFCGDQSAVSWDSEFQRTYYILVQGRSIQRSIGDFQLSIEARYNDECNNVITLKASAGATTHNVPIIKGQTLEANPNAFVCNGVVNESPSLFYAVRGTGDELAVIFQGGIDFNPRISVLVGDCSNLSCVAQSGEGDVQLSWASFRDINYFIMVHGETASDVGNFAFQVRSVDAAAQGRVPW